MTIRRILRKKLAVSMLSMAVGFLFCVGSVISTVYFQLEKVPSLFFLGFTMIVAAQVYVFLFIKCPGCNRNLGPLLFMTLKSINMDTRLNSCPFCGAAFDAE